MLTASLLLVLGLVVILVIIVINGYFVAQEFAYMSVDRVRLQAQASQDDEAAARALKVTKRTSFMLSGAQLGITVTGLLVGYVAEPLVGESLGVLLGGVGVPSEVSITVGTVLALVFATIVQMIFGELYPKNLAIASPEPLARALARSTLIYLAVFGWLITLFDRAADGLLRLFGIEPVHDVDTAATAEDLDRIVSDSRESGDLSEDLSVLIDRILDFPDQDVAHAMIPRSRVGIVAPDTPVAQVRGLMVGAHTRYPVVSIDDEPLGVVHLIDVMERDATDALPVSEIMRPPLIVPEAMPLPDVLRELTESRNQLACVIDEYGGFAGVITVEDLAEELVGELTDEHDPAPLPDAHEISEGTWHVAGDLPVDELERLIGYPLPDGEFETTSGLVIASLGGLPEVGEVVTIELPTDPRDFGLATPLLRSIRVVVTELDRSVPSALTITLHETGGHNV